MATYSNAIKKVYQIYFSKLGTILETFGDTHFNAQDDEVAVIKAFIEDGVVDNVTTLVNFTPEGRTAFTSHWFPMFYRGLQEKIVSGEAEPRTFAQFEITLPSIVLLMNGGKTSVSQSMTVIQRYGSTHLGNFATITDLNTDNPASETYFDDSVVAFVYSNEAGQTDQVGFYQVEEVEEVWTWVLKTTLLYALSTKQYNGATFTVGRGPSNPQGVPTVSQSLIYQLMQEISYLDIGYESLNVDMTDLQDKVEALRDGSLPIEFNKNGTNLTSTQLDLAIKEVNVKTNTNENDITNIENGTTPITFDKSGTDLDAEFIEEAIKEVNVKTNANEQNIEKIVDGTTIVKKAEQDASGNVITATYETKADATSKLATKVDKTRKIIGIDLQDDILLTEFKTAIGNATQSVAGLLSAEDKTHLDGLVALLETSDGDTIVDTIGEILAIFQNYPEGADLVTVLQGKVDKVVGKELSTNDFTDLLKAKLDSLLDGTQYYDKTYIDSLKNMNGWESELLGTLSNNGTIALSIINQYNEIQMYAKDTLGVIDNENIRPSLMQSGDSVYFFDDTEAFIMVDTVFGFYAPIGYTLQVVGLKYTELKAVETTYDNTASGLDAENVQEAIDELQDEKVDKTSIVDNLTTDDATKVLSAKQGKQLKIIVDGLDERVDILESKIDVIGLDYKEYGIREVVGQSASEFERVTRFGGEIKLGSSTGLVANVAIDDAVVANSFDYIPIFKREKVSIQATDLSSNVVSNTFVKVPKYYIKEEWTNEGGTDYHYYWMCSKNLTGYRLPLPFKKTDGTERDYAYMGAYEAFLDANNKLRSLTGQFPKVTYSRNNFRTAARALDGLGVDSKYQITDLAEYVDLVQIPFMIEFATKHSQGIFLGATSMAYSATHTAVADGTGVNFIVVSNATGANFVLGQTISIGTANSNSTVTNDRVVTLIEVDTPNAGETKITFDGAAVNIVIGNVIASRGWKTGATDQVKVSGTHALNDGKHSIVWRGLENPFGNIWKNVDGVKISNQKAYVTENPKDYNDTASAAGVYAEPYLPLGYTNALTNNYAQDLGYDANYPYAKFPITVQASSALYFRDYYYQNTGDRTVFVGGDWADGSAAGLFYWFLGIGLGNAGFNRGARLSYRP
jgi:hypothetical protein